MTPRHNRSEAPILAVDVDGVINLFGFDEQPDESVGRFYLFDGMPHFISAAAGERLRRLLPYYELVWATGWEERANDHLTRLLGLPQLPVIGFGRDARFGTAHWKLGPLGAYAGRRPLAWIDDSLNGECRSWAAERREPTLLVETASAIGIQDAHVETLIDWVRGGAAGA